MNEQTKTEDLGDPHSCHVSQCKAKGFPWECICLDEKGAPTGFLGHLQDEYPVADLVAAGLFRDEARN